MAPTTSPFSMASTWPSVLGPGPWATQAPDGDKAAVAGTVQSRAANRIAAHLRPSGWRSAGGNSRLADTIFKGHLPDERCCGSMRFYKESGSNLEVYI